MVQADAKSAADEPEISGGDLWIFAYGSLMWRPDFVYAERYAARLDGWHRRFCILSRHYRGSAVHPGLLLGLDRGGSCEGMAFKVAPSDAAGVLAYLRVREQISGVYREARRPIKLQGAGVQIQSAIRMAVVFLAEPAHPSFSARLPVPLQARIIASAKGTTGSNLEYLAQTLEALQPLGIRERELERIAAVIGYSRISQRRIIPSRRWPGPIRSLPDWPRTPRVALHDVKRFTHRTKVPGG